MSPSQDAAHRWALLVTVEGYLHDFVHTPSNGHEVLLSSDKGPVGGAGVCRTKYTASQIKRRLPPQAHQLAPTVNSCFSYALSLLFVNVTIATVYHTDKESGSDEGANVQGKAANALK